MESEKLIEEVQKFPALYDQSDEKYRHTEYKEKVWNIISKTLEAPGGPEECRKRWASIRDQFRRTLQKRTKRSGRAAAKRHKYKYEGVLEFLLPHLAEKETPSNVPSMEDQMDDSEFYPSVEEHEHYPECVVESLNEVDVLLYPGTSSQSTSPVPPAKSRQALAIPGEKNHLSRPLNVEQQGFNREEPAQESSLGQIIASILAEKNQVNATSPQQHPVDIFLAGLAPTLKSLDPVLLNQAKTVIFTTVQEFELKQISKNESQQQITGSNDSSHASVTNNHQ